MNKIQTQLVSCLDAAIHGEKIEVNVNKYIEWKSLIEEAKIHNIEALIYSSISSKSLKNIDDRLLDIWKKNTFMSGAYQINHINQISNVLRRFNEERISVIVLKGLVIRDLYPKKELRTMCDADILVKVEELDNVRNILYNLGYQESGSSEIHLDFKKGSSNIEIHWTIASEDYFEEIPDFEMDMWKNTIQVQIGNSYALSMNDEYLALHLCIHMAKHIRYRGFGVRQLCDLVLLVEQKKNLINWDNFIEKIKLCGVYKFTVCIFMICNKLFGMEIPNNLDDKSLVDDKCLNLLIEDIFSNGVHGRGNSSATVAKELARTHGNYKYSILQRYITFLLPSTEELSIKYNYIEKFKILTPIAWGIYFFKKVFSSKYSILDKAKFLIFGINISKKRNRLLNWLELQ